MEGRQAQNVHAEETSVNIAACRGCGRLVPHTRQEGEPVAVPFRAEPGNPLIQPGSGSFAEDEWVWSVLPEQHADPDRRDGTRRSALGQSHRFAPIVSASAQGQ